jgi:uncharacterized protein (TIGR02646 family)
VKHIEKDKEPLFFTQWKKSDKMYNRGKPNWNRLSSEDKRNLRNSLIKEQGAVCCYCGVRIVVGNSHVEHFRPKGKNGYPHLQLDYNNLLCSCQLELQKAEPKHCGNAKGSWFDEELIISPLNSACESSFEFLEDGRIRPFEMNNEGAKQTISSLALDISKLDELRKSSIAAALDSIDVFDRKTIQEQIDVYSQRNPGDKQFAPFCSAILNVLSSLLT